MPFGAAQGRDEIWAVQEIKLMSEQFKRQGGAFQEMVRRCPKFG